jgi:uncharacterized membrane protein YagU involved in acid resistance
VNPGSWALWGFVGTVVLTIGLAASQRFGVTRMNIPYMLGVMFTPNRDRAKVLGVLVHFVNGWLFSLLYVAAFESWQRTGVLFGAAIGLVHGLFALSIVLPFLPGIHPRMASESRGPEVVEQLEPPGFFALNYGVQTPASVIVTHVSFGAIIGAFYVLSR